MTPAEQQIRAALAAGPTPGPWWVDPNFCRDVRAEGTEISVAYQASDEGKKVTVPGPINVEPATAEANAKLIAACNPAALAELLAELDGERNRSQMYANLVRGVAVVLHGEGWSDTSKLPEEVARLRAEVEALRVDADRYRWLASHCKSYDEPYKGGWSIHVQGAVPARHDCEDAMDAAIDAAKGGATCEQR